MASTNLQKLLPTVVLFATLLFVNVSVIMTGQGPLPVQASHLSQPVVGVWSDAYPSGNVTDLSLTSGEFTVKVNVTETPDINGYEFFLDYNAAYISATKVLIKEGTFFGAACFLCNNDTSTVGVVRVSIVVTSSDVRSGSGILAFITFRVLGIGATALNVRDDTLLYGGNLIAHATEDGMFRNTANRPPTARFTFSPVAPIQEEIVTFDASGTTDPDSPTLSYFWKWGDDAGTDATANPVITHVFRDRNGNPSYGPFIVILTVTDDTELTDTTSTQITVTQKPFRDILIASLTSNFLTANPGQTVTLSVRVGNGGTDLEITQLRIFVGTTLIDSRDGISLNPGQSVPIDIRWDTAGLTPSVYRITANVTIVTGEANIDNNSKFIFVSIASPISSLSTPLIVASGTGVVAVIAAAFFILRRRRPRAE